MKIRSDFVTNSSSSSYILAFRNPSAEIITDDELNKLSPVAKNLIQSALCAYKNILKEADYNISTKEELDKYFVKEYSWGDYHTLDEILEDDNYLKKSYDKRLKCINDGYTVTEFTVDYSEESKSTMLYNICDGENIIMIERDC